PIPPMKYEHTFVLTYGLGGTHSGISLSAPITGRSPLKSQPLLELCMRIPVEVHQKGGLDRRVARAAFRHDIPEDIYRRKSKSFSTHRSRNMLTGRSSEVRETLLGGYLIENGYLDEKTVSESLSKIPTASQSETLPILDIMA